MFSKSNTQQQHQSRKNFLRLSGAALLAATSLSLLAGCGGGGSNSGGSNSGGGGNSGTSIAPGNYQGVSLNTSGQYAPDAGTTQIFVSSDGSINLSTIDYTGDGSTTSVSGTISSTGQVVLNPTGDKITGTVSQNATTHVISGSYTESNGTKGILRVGLVPTTSPLAGSYSGTYSGDGGNGTITIAITAGGTVTGSFSPSTGTGRGLSGFVDSTGTLYIAHAVDSGDAIGVGGLTLNGTSLGGTLTETSSDSSTSTVTLSLTKQ